MKSTDNIAGFAEVASFCELGYLILCIGYIYQLSISMNEIAHSYK